MNQSTLWQWLLLADLPLIPLCHKDVHCEWIHSSSALWLSYHCAPLVLRFQGLARYWIQDVWIFLDFKTINHSFWGWACYWMAKSAIHTHTKSQQSLTDNALNIPILHLRPAQRHVFIASSYLLEHTLHKLKFNLRAAHSSAAVISEHLLRSTGVEFLSSNSPTRLQSLANPLCMSADNSLIHLELRDLIGRVAACNHPKRWSANNLRYSWSHRLEIHHTANLNAYDHHKEWLHGTVLCPLDTIVISLARTQSGWHV